MHTHTYTHTLTHTYTHTHTGASSGSSPGFGVTLVAETTSGCLISAEACAKHDHARSTQGTSSSNFDEGMMDVDGGGGFAHVWV